MLSLVMKNIIDFVFAFFMLLFSLVIVGPASVTSALTVHVLCYCC